MKVKRRVLREAFASFLTVFLLLSLGLASAYAQTETGQITVKATDPQGAVLPGAAVSVKSTTTGAERTATTSGEGIATVTNLQPGVYDVTVTSGSFAPYKQQAQVSVGGNITVDAVLSITAKGETVTIVAGEEGIQVNTQSQELSDVVSGKQITELPTLTRNPYDLVGLAGNVAVEQSGSGRGTGFAINGQRAASTNVLLDGGENVDLFTAAIGQSVPLDAVQEFRVITSNFSAEYGRASGGIVNVATKAGSNSFHGSLYEFNRISALASNSYDNNAQGIAKPVFTRNQFGYSVGGRVIKDKLFFFSSTEWTRIRSAGEVISLVPTPQLLAASNANTKNYFNAFQLVSPINGATFSVAQVLANFGLPATGAFGSLPGGLPAFGEVRATRAADFGAGLPGNDWQTVGRLDYNWSDKTQIYVRGVYEQGSTPLGTISFSPYQGFNTAQTTGDQNYLGNVTHSFSSNIVSQTKVVFNRLRNGDQPLGQQPLVPTLYFTDQGVLSAFGKFFRFPGYLPTTPGNGIPFGGPQNFLQAYEDVSWTHGAHTFRFGGVYVHIRDNRTFGAYAYASSVLGLNAGSALNNFIAGNLRRFSVAAFPQGKFPCHNDVNTGATIVTPDCTLTTPLAEPNFSRSNRYHEWATYFNDSWKVKPRLTLNLGVRYEYYGTQHNANQALDSNFYFGQGNSIQERIANGQILLAKDAPGGKLWAVDPNNFAPRLGIAWDVFGDGKMSLRGGYGMAYERNFGNVTFNVIQNPPNNATVQFNAGTDVATIPITLDNLGPLAGSGVNKPFARVSLRAVDPNIRNAYAHFWSAAIERQLPGNSIVSIEYSGSAGRNLYSIANINRIGSENVFLGKGPTTDFFGDGRPPQGSGRLNNNGAAAINFRGSDGRSNYNAMIVSFDTSKLHNLGLRLGVRYTYSITRDNLSSTFSEDQNGNFNLGYLDPFNPNLDYGFSNNDVRHRFVTNFTWDIPSPKSAEGWVKHVVGGWELTGIYVARTGAPFSVFDCTNAINVCSRAILDGPVNLRGSINHDSIGVGDTPNRYKYIDLSGLTPGSFVDSNGFAEFAPFPSNMSKRNAFRAPGVWNLDAALYKNIQVKEGMRIQLRLETYNLLNHANLFVSGGEAEVNTGFVPASFDGRRNIQLAGKFIF
ncbi:MAG TPA: TonB-dependent receptor [Blastocatellia bacterium]|nr:TonB-dependent receptor [Blastocatellia bacterium]